MLPAKEDKILIIDDDPGMLTLVQGVTGFSDSQLVSARTLSDGLQLAASRRFEVVLLDHRLPDGQGVDQLENLLHQDRMRPILYITAQSGSETAIEAIKRGAFEYISKPIDFGLLRKRISEAIEYRRLTRLPVLVDNESVSATDQDVLVGRCRAMQNVYKAIGRLAMLSTPALIEGEAGTGKEMIARAIHQHGARVDTSFRVFSSEDAALVFSPNELQSNVHKQHLIAEPMKPGTVLIEEIGDVPQNVQQRILRVLQDSSSAPEERKYERLIFSTSIPCRELVESNRLRSDLFYFLSPYIVRVPSLRDRPEDFELLIAHFMQRLAQISPIDEKSGPPRISATAIHILKGYDWPGNVAQLKSVLQSVLMESRGAVLATDTLNRALESQIDKVRVSSESFVDPSLAIMPNAMDPKLLANVLGTSIPLKSFSWDIADFVKSEAANETTSLYDNAITKLDSLLINEVLCLTQGNQAQAARMLGMTRTSLRKKILHCRIDPLQHAPPRYAEPSKPNQDEH